MFYEYFILDLVKRGVLTLVSEISRYRSDYYYYCQVRQPLSVCFLFALCSLRNLAYFKYIMLFLCVFLLLCLLVDSQSSLERKALSFLCRDCFRSDPTANADFDPCVRSAFSVIFYVKVPLCSDRRAENGFYPVGLIFVHPSCFVFRPRTGERKLCFIQQAVSLCILLALCSDRAASGNCVLSSRPYLCASFLFCVPTGERKLGFIQQTVSLCILLALCSDR